MIILEDRTNKTASFCNDDLKHLCEFTNVVVDKSSFKDYICIKTVNDDCILLTTREDSTTIIRTDPFVVPYMTIVYEVEDLEEPVEDEDEDDNESENDEEVTNDMLHQHMYFLTPVE